MEMRIRRNIDHHVIVSTLDRNLPCVCRVPNTDGVKLEGFLYDNELESDTCRADSGNGVEK